MLATFWQILLEVSLTYRKIFVTLTWVPIIHFSVLMILFSISKLKNRDIKTFPANVRKISVRRCVAKKLKTLFYESLSLKNKFKYLLLYATAIAGAFIVGIFPGIFGGPSTVDERAYHWPQILGIIQNNGFTTFDSALPWTYAYPLGNAQMGAFAWTLTKTDLSFRATQIPLGILCLLAIYLIGSQISRRTGFLSVLLLACSPLFSILLRMSTDDLAYGTFTLSTMGFLVFGLRSRNLKEQKTSFYLALVGFAIIGQFKFPLIALIFCGPLFLFYIFRMERRTSYNVLKRLFLLMLSILVSTDYMIRNLLVYKNPVFPMTLKVLGHTFFSGPLISIDNTTINPSTTFEINSPFRLLKLWHATFYDWFQVPNEDSLGSYNYLIGSVILVSAIIFIVRLQKASLAFQIITPTALIICLTLPGIFLPRYGFFVVAIICIIGAAIFSTILNTRKLQMTVGILAVLGLTPIFLQDLSTYRWIKSQSSHMANFGNQQVPIDEKYDLATDGSVVPSTVVTWIHHNIKKGEVMCYNAAVNYPSSYWNVARDSKTYFKPINSLDRYPSANDSHRTYVNPELEFWLQKNQICDFLGVYPNVASEILTLRNNDWKLATKSSTLEILRRVH